MTGIILTGGKNSRISMTKALIKYDHPDYDIDH